MIYIELFIYYYKVEVFITSLKNKTKRNERSISENKDVI